jgi:cell division protein FtsN
VEELKKLFSKSSGSGNEPPAAGTDTLFHIQLGAFGQRPGMTEYKRAGKVNVITENGLYKVLVGGFRTRDEAVRRRQELAGNGFEGFIVRYAGQRRVY